MLENIVRRIRRRSREAYQEEAFGAITALRIWVQENAERAAIAFLVVGFLIPFLYKLVLLVGALVALVGFSVWTIALPQALSQGQESSGATHSGGEVSSEPGSSPSGEWDDDMRSSAVEGEVPRAFDTDTDLPPGTH